MSDSEHRVPDGEIVLVIHDRELRDVRIGRRVRIHVIHTMPFWADKGDLCQKCPYHAGPHIHRRTWNRDLREEQEENLARLDGLKGDDDVRKD